MTDEFTPATSYLVVACTSRSRYFDLDAVREPHKPHGGTTFTEARERDRQGRGRKDGPAEFEHNPAGAPPLDYWIMPWEQVVARIVKAMVPERVCRTCGEPSRRLTSVEYEAHGDPDRQQGEAKAGSRGRDVEKVLLREQNAQAMTHGRATKNVETLGWTDCGHDDWREGVVLDPFSITDSEADVNARYIIGDTLETLRTLPDASVDLVMTSPPFLALRSYLAADHPDKAKEMGSEPTPGAWLDAQLDVVEECRRVLAPHGSIVWEIGDTYAGSGGAGGDYEKSQWRDGQPKFDGSARRERRASGGAIPGNISMPKPGTASRFQDGPGWPPLDKSLCLMPSTFAWALAYGRNPWTGRELEPWRVRNLIAWCRPNPPVGALGDKFRPATSYLTVACTSRSRYFDLDAVREPYSELTMKVHGGRDAETGCKTGPKSTATRGMDTAHLTHAGAPPLDYWELTPASYSGAHYAVFPESLVVRPVKAMCPERVCRVCGEPSRRVVGEPSYEAARQKFTPDTEPGSGFRDAGAVRGMSGTKAPAWKHQDTVGWTDCGHDDWRRGVLLDPFAGTGTALAVAVGHGRDAIGIDLDPRNVDLARERVGMFLTIETPAA